MSRTRPRLAVARCRAMSSIVLEARRIPMKRRLDRRGSVLLLVVVLLAVISLLPAAAVAFSHSELGAARNDRSGDELLACADAGRQYMLSRFSLTGVPMDLSAVNKDVNSAGIVDCKSSAEQ